MTDAESKSLEDGFSTDNLWIPCPKLVQGQYYLQDKNQNTRACKQQWPTNIDVLSTQKLVTACCIRKLEVLTTRWYTLYRCTMAAPKKKRRIGFVCQNLKMTRYEGLKQDDIHTRWSHPPSTSIKHHQMVLNLWFHPLHPTHVVSFGSVLYEWKRLRNYHMGKLYLNLEVVHCIVPRPYPSFGWTQPNFGLLQMVPSCKLIKTDLSIGISRITPTAIGLISVNLANINHPWITNSSRYIGMDQYLLIPFLGEWTSIYQLFWCSPGVQGFDTLPYHFKVPFLVVKSTCLVVKSWEIHTFWSPRSVPPVAYLHGHQTPDLASQQFTHIEPGSPWILSLGFAHPDPSKKKI